MVFLFADSGTIDTAFENSTDTCTGQNLGRGFGQ